MTMLMTLRCKAARIATVAVTVAVGLLSVQGAEALPAGDHRHEVRVEFPVNSTVLDSTYRDNARALRSILSFIREVEGDTLSHINGITFRGTASPDGEVSANRRLARGRLEALERYVGRGIDLGGVAVAYDDSCIPWDYLAERVHASDLAGRDRVLAILAGESEEEVNASDSNISGRIARLKALDGGRTWQEIYRRYFADMRTAGALFFVHTDEPVPEPVAVPVAEPEAETKNEPAIVPEPLREPAVVTEPETAITSGPLSGPAVVSEPAVADGSRWYLKTNLLGLAALLLNVEGELELGHHWSAVLPIYYSGFNYFTSKVMFRAVAFYPEMRYRFRGHDGWFAGAHVGVAYYDVATGGELRTQDRDGDTPALGGGLTVGYRLPLGKKGGPWRLEFSAGAGVYHVSYEKYLNRRNGRLVRSGSRTYWGPDRVAVSLVYSFDK